jgi:phosphoglycolate phosphatase
MPATLLLFDIDGTLITSGGTGEPALRMGLRDGFGIDDDLNGIEIAGRTDTGIAMRLLERNGIPPSPANIERLLSHYLPHLEAMLPRKNGRILPGVLALLDALQQSEEFALGLLTGNVETGARLKLSHHRLWERFSFGAYADDHPDRNHLVPFARQRAAKIYGLDFLPEKIWVIGDTPHDVACARAGGVRAAAVATGIFGMEVLAGTRADAVWEDLSDTRRVIETFLHQ